MHVAVVHNNVDQASSIGKLASWAVRTALEADHQVTVVARDLDPHLRSAVRWRSLYVPPKLHAVQWAAARKTVQAALRGVRPNVLHVYQAQLASIADTWHVEYLSRVAVETDSLHRGGTVKDRLTRLQQLAVAEMEDRYLRRPSPRPTVLFCSEQLREHFVRLYGAPRHHDVLHNPSFSPRIEPVSRAGARAHFGLPEDVFVVGYLGGVDERKGYRELLDAVSSSERPLHVLMAGPQSEGFVDPRLSRRLVSAGMLSDLSPFWAAVDVLAVPSRFDPFAMVVTEAATNGIPSLVTPGVGASDLVARYSAGEVRPADSLVDGLAALYAKRDSYGHGTAQLASAVDATVLARTLLSHWDRVVARLAPDAS